MIRNTLRLSGSFSAPLMHEWVTACLPEVRMMSMRMKVVVMSMMRKMMMLPLMMITTTTRVMILVMQVPPRIASATEEANSTPPPITLYFRNVYTHSVFTCEYTRGTANIASDSISSIAIFKEVRATTY
jgi:hypothetical protein